MNIFITGGTGFIGKRIVRGLCDHYETVYLLVRKKSLNKAKITFSNIENIVLVEGDLTENDILYSLDDFYKLKKRSRYYFQYCR
jgi:nucleoside-diphosphate-sugar epimerase